MPCAYWIYSAENILVKQYVGRVTPQCVLQIMDSIDRDPAYRPGMAEFDDMRHVKKLDLTIEDVARFAEIMKWLSTRLTTPSRKAVLAPDRDVRLAVRDFTGDLGKDGEHLIGIFAEVDPALNFLGLGKADLGELLRGGKLLHH